MEWGRATYTILRLPPDISAELVTAGAKRVEGEIAEHPVNAGLARAPVVEGVFLWAGQSLLDRIGIAVGESVEVRLRPVAVDVVDTPDDLLQLLRQEGLSASWESLTAGKRRGMLHHINTAKTPGTRSKRLGSLIDALKPAQ